MTFYQRTIVKATRCTEEDAVLIEEIMRNDIFHSTLDWQPSRVFNRGARQAKKLLGELREMGIIERSSITKAEKAITAGGGARQPLASEVTASPAGR